MPDTCCTATTATGQPCAACPLPGRPFCLFHDPEVEALLAADLSVAPTAEPSAMLAAEVNAHRPFPSDEKLTPDDLHACLEALSSFPFLPVTAPTASVSAPYPASATGADPNPKSKIQNTKSDEASDEPEQVPEQVLDRCATGLPATDTTPDQSPPARPAPLESVLAPASDPEPTDPPAATAGLPASAADPPAVRYYPAWPAGPSAPVGSPGPGCSPFG